MNKSQMIARIHRTLGLVITLAATLLLGNSAWAGKGLPNNYTTAASAKATDNPSPETDPNTRIEGLKMQIEAVQSTVASQQMTLNTLQSQLRSLQRTQLSK